MSRRETRYLLAHAFLLGACVQDRGTTPPPTCSDSIPCGADYTCVSNQCIQNAQPGDLQFAAEAFAPANRPDMLARSEILGLNVDETSGKVSVMFTQAIEYSGRVLLHSSDTLSAAAKIVFHRPSRIAGAPDYQITVTAAPGKVAGEAAFKVLLPPNVGTETYDITIYPDDGSLFAVAPGDSAPNALAPPATLSGQTIKTSPTSPVSLTVDTSGPSGLRTLGGVVVDAAGAPLSGMIVRAFDEPSKLTDERHVISSTATTDGNGNFAIYMPANRASFFDLEVTPGPNVVAPTLIRKQPAILSGDRVTAGSILGVGEIDYPSYPAFIDYQLPVSYSDVAGGHTIASGARVIFSTTLASGIQDTVTYQVDTTVDAAGYAHARLIPGDTQNRTYVVTVLPPQNLPAQSVWATTIAVGPTPSGQGSAVLTPLLLGKRVQVVGRLVDSQGHAAGNVIVRPQISSAFFAQFGDQLNADIIDGVAALSLPEAMTDPLTSKTAGAFSMYLDAKLQGKPAIYDFEVVPPGGSVLPQWSFDTVAVTGTATVMDIGTLTLPAAAVASGKVTDTLAKEVADAEVRVYSKTSSDATWKLRTLAKSDDKGAITLVLPSTP